MSNLKDLIPMSPETEEELETEYFLTNLSGKLHAMKESSGLSVRGLAKKMGSSKSLLWRILNEAKNTSVTTLLRFSKACGYEMSINFVQKESSAEVPSKEDSDE